MCNPALAAVFKGLVKQVGGTEAARAVIEASVGHTVSKGTISQVQNGNASVPLEWAWALEDAAGIRPFYRLRAQLIEEHDLKEENTYSHLDIIREATEAALANAEAEGSQCPKVISESLAQLQDIIHVAQQCAARDQARLSRMGFEGEPE